MTKFPIEYGPLQTNDEEDTSTLICKNFHIYSNGSSLFASTLRRAESLFDNYNQKGCVYLVASYIDTISNKKKVLGGVGIGPFQGLSVAEGVGEIRDLVVEQSFRGKNIGSTLVRMAIDRVKYFGYNRVYLETTEAMEVARSLFERYGFNPVTSAPDQRESQKKHDEMPCYYLLDLIHSGQGFKREKSELNTADMSSN